MTTTLTQKQRDALRKLDEAANDPECRGRVYSAILDVRLHFADALRPPKMATREYEDRDGIACRVARLSDGTERVEYRGKLSRAWGYLATDWGAALLAAARDTEFHEVDD
jgi:hypothetical protein